ncbi:hypothetical protein BS47DRAFT_1321067 [Hydnum rufescens UP504]|uniref:Dihydroorotate oxidase n=1 Tax=Hydnum rufescens UP504 TaxID=1448309 RepID=A0A9P6DQU9_9AGAM|nr:hypothetical protein BS47DRAFT_1321067 [Hydnum rufescens UP504]
MTEIGSLFVSPPIINSSCPWASDLDDLSSLYESPFTGAVTTRTATWSGFEEDSGVHRVAFHARSYSSINSYGYSPIPLNQYLEWINVLFIQHPTSTKPFIISITSSDPQELDIMIDTIRRFRFGGLGRVAIELNTSCPNIENKPPPSYDIRTLSPLLDVLHRHAEDSNCGLTLGIKLPPYVHAGQFADIVGALAAMKSPASTPQRHPISFLTCTNTLGSCLLFDEQAIHPSPNGSKFALPTILGGLAGDALHALSLGNVHSFHHLLSTHRDERLRTIKIIGVGGVTSPEAAQRMYKAGASVVACATALGKEGVEIFQQLSPACAVS